MALGQDAVKHIFWRESFVERLKIATKDLLLIGRVSRPSDVHHQYVVTGTLSLHFHGVGLGACLRCYRQNCWYWLCYSCSSSFQTCCCSSFQPFQTIWCCSSFQPCKTTWCCSPFQPRKTTLCCCHQPCRLPCSKAGYYPAIKSGTLIFASKVPYLNMNLPCVLIRPDVKLPSWSCLAVFSRWGTVLNLDIAPAACTKIVRHVPWSINLITQYRKIMI